MSDAYTRLNLNDIYDVAPGNGFADRWEARVASELGSDQTGITHFRLRPGKRSPFSHRHRGAEEIYIVLKGLGRMKLGETIIEVRPLDAIRVPPETARAFEAGPDGLEFIAVGPRHPGDGEPVEDPWVQ